MDKDKFNLKLFVPHFKDGETKVFYAPAGHWTDLGEGFDVEIAPDVYVVIPKTKIVQLNYEPIK